VTATPHILLTGGTGFFGRALLRNWAAAAEAGSHVPRVTVLSRSPEAFGESHPEFIALPWLEFHAGDMCAAETLPRHESFSCILHAATDSTLGPRLTPLARYAQIVDGTRNLQQVAVDKGVPRLLLTSSGAIYGPQPADVERIPEDWPGSPSLLEPANAYGLAKRAAEHLCTLYRDAYGLETIVARCFAFVGRDLPLDVHFAIGNFIRDALHADAIEVAGDGSPLRTYLDQGDLARWLVTLLERGQSGQSYNVGSDEVISIGELAHLVRDIIAPQKPVHIRRLPSGSAGRNRYVPDIRKAQGELGLDVRISLADAVRRTGEFHRRGSLA
jgi:UDP-glucuronate decarboxylase